MDNKTHLHVWALRILPRQNGGDHDGKYMGYVHKSFYDPESGETFLDFYERDDVDEEYPQSIEKDTYLYSQFTFRDPDTGEAITQDYTHTKEYLLPPRRKKVMREGIRECAEFNLKAYKIAFKSWIYYKDLFKDPPVSKRATGIIEFYESVVADSKQWYIENYRKYLPKLPGEILELPNPKMPDKGRRDTVWLRENKWSKLRDRLYKDRSIAFAILLDAATDIPRGRPKTLTDVAIYISFCNYVNRKIRTMTGADSNVSAKIDFDKKQIVLSRKGKRKK